MKKECKFLKNLDLVLKSWEEELSKVPLLFSLPQKTEINIRAVVSILGILTEHQLDDCKNESHNRLTTEEGKTPQQMNAMQKESLDCEFFPK